MITLKQIPVIYFELFSRCSTVKQQWPTRLRCFQFIKEKTRKLVLILPSIHP